jgi:hypothetical protein
MKRRVWLSAACVVFGASVAVETLACGDKLLVVGRGARYQRGYVAIHPTSVLLVAAGSSTGSELLAPLKRAGHRVEIVRDSGELRRAIASDNYEVVLADWSQASEVQALVSSAASSAMFVPVLSGAASASDLEAAKKTYGCPLDSSKPKLNKNFLGRLDDVIDAKRKSKPLSCNVQ